MSVADVMFGIDTETGGFEPGRHALLAIGCWWNSGGGIERGLKVLVQRRRGEVVEPEAQERNGWESDAQWEDLGALPINMAVWRLLDYVEKLQRLTRARRLVPVAHHERHDRGFIEYGLTHCGAGGYPLERWHEHVSHHWRCSMQGLLVAMDAGCVAEGSAGLDRLIALSGQGPRPSVHDPRDDARYAVAGYNWLMGAVRGCGTGREAVAVTESNGRAGARPYQI